MATDNSDNTNTNTKDMTILDTAHMPIVRNNAFNILEKSINDKVRTKDIFKYIQLYLVNSKVGDNNNALITGSAVTYALSKSISGLYNAPNINSKDWTFNDIDIVTNNEFGVIVMFQTLYKWANRTYSDVPYTNHLDNWYNPSQIVYTKGRTYPPGTLNPKMDIKSTHIFKIDKLSINLTVIGGCTLDFIKCFDLTINQVHCDGTRVYIGPGNSEMIYRHLFLKEFPALYRTYNRSTWAVTLERIEKYRKRGFTIRLSQSIVVDKPNENGVVPKERLSIIDRYYKVKMIYEPINAMCLADIPQQQNIE
jgi:hypothetical protein